jgi:hypothetical protein
VSNVITMEGSEALPEDIIKRATEQDFKTIIVLGRLKDGTLYQDTSTSLGPEALMLLEQGRFDLLHNMFG